ncbi:Fe-S oxidoreductase [Desulfacinum hydrothermale DSM 13146]|uniref:Fe-S oxidoreductase n=1 Tax=Desulfacinum hydrothermale DSM 13146 TaxID=1121390 RepID=A0A1W1XNK5_9BACT|nr:(Fe-S)-binding protein [Desulfacinum hydrothermale]SMC25486.1 Fe-S oxidoreductase [Desulfacinum hydrothermale DSM 13146]
MYHPKAIVDLIAGNVRKTRNPFGAFHFVMNRWWKNLDLPRDGSTLFYTGLMVQSVPFIERITRQLEALEDTSWAPLVGYGSWIPKRLVQVGSLFMTTPKERAPYEQILKDMVALLRRSGVRFAYRPDLDLYSGILLYDLGDQEAFEAHARFVAKRLQEAGVRTLITVDPHTTYAFKVLYPKYVGAEFEVRTYFELLRLQGEPNGTRVTLHDPCFFGRYLKLSHVPRRVLRDVGVAVADVQQSGPLTHCCGGPAESVSPKLSREIVERRVDQLKQTGAPILSMCPICMGNLKKAGADVQDLASFLARRVSSSGNGQNRKDQT